MFSPLFQGEGSMKKCLAAAALVATLLMVRAGVADDKAPVKSGPQVGEVARPKPFMPLNINGPTPNEKQCLVCRNGNNPVAMIFAREPNETLVKLIKKLDVETVHNADKKMGSFAVFCNDTEGLEAKLKDLAKQENLKAFTLAIDSPAGPEPYNISKDADVTVVLYNKSKVLANFAFKKGELKDADVQTILSNVNKILQ
jgi:hypothetical protein